MEKNRIPNQKVLSFSKRDEKEFLALLVKEKDVLDKAIRVSKVDATFFLHPENANMFKIISMVHDKYDTTLSAPMMDKIMEENSRIDSVVGAQHKAFFRSIEALKVNKDMYEKLKDNLEARYVQQQFYDLVIGDEANGNFFEKIVNATSGQKELVFGFQDRMKEIKTTQNLGAEAVARTASESLEKVIATLANRRDNPDDTKGILCGFTEIDDAISGFRRKKYAVVSAAPNGGKTLFMNNLAMNMAGLGSVVVYVTMESSDEEMAERLLSTVSGIPSKALRKGGSDEDGLNPNAFSKLLAAKKEIDDTFGDNLIFIHVPRNTPLSVITNMVDSKLKYLDVEVLIVDYLDVIARESSYPGRPDLELADISVKLQSYGETKDIFVVTAQSWNNEKLKQFRTTEAQDDPSKVTGGVNVEDIGGTQKIARDADDIFGVALNKAKDKLFVFWPKARFSAAGGYFILKANCDIGKLSNFVPTDIDANELQSSLQDGFSSDMFNDDWLGDDSYFNVPEITADEPASKVADKPDIVEPVVVVEATEESVVVEQVAKAVFENYGLD